MANVPICLGIINWYLPIQFFIIKISLINCGINYNHQNIIGKQNKIEYSNKIFN